MSLWSRHKLGVLGALLLLAIVLAAVLAPELAPFPPDTQFPDGLSDDGGPLPPGGRFLLGRDLLSRLIYGARTSLIIGVVANGMAVVTGTLLGVTAGYLRGPIGGAIMRVTDLMMAFPALLLAIALAAILEPSLWIVAMVIALLNWVQIARVIYTETSSLA